MYYQVIQNKLKTLTHIRGRYKTNIRQPLKKEKGCGPKVFSVRRFYCTFILGAEYFTPIPFACFSTTVLYNYCNALSTSLSLSNFW